MKFNLVVNRFDPTRDSIPYNEGFEVEAEPYETVLDLLIKAWQGDPTISFRRSCRSGICGSCAMSINGTPKLACQAKSGDYAGEAGIILEPLPNFRRLKDLVVDMDWFFDNLKAVLPWLVPRPEYDGLMQPEDCARVESPATCILCGACDAALVLPGTIKPAAMVKTIRLAFDSRDALGRDRLKLAGLDEEDIRAFRDQLATLCPKGIVLPV